MRVLVYMVDNLIDIVCFERIKREKNMKRFCRL
jgi:hypothetical protein